MPSNMQQVFQEGYFCFFYRFRSTEIINRFYENLGGGYFIAIKIESIFSVSGEQCRYKVVWKVKEVEIRLLFLEL